MKSQIFGSALNIVIRDDDVFSIFRHFCSFIHKIFVLRFIFCAFELNFVNICFVFLFRLFDKMKLRRFHLQRFEKNKTSNSSLFKTNRSEQSKDKRD